MVNNLLMITTALFLGGVGIFHGVEGGNEHMSCESVSFSVHLSWHRCYGKELRKQRQTLHG